jgi:PAS domain S-box
MHTISTKKDSVAPHEAAHPRVGPSVPPREPSASFFSTGRSGKRSSMQETQRLLERAVEAVGTGIVIADARRADYPILYCNPAFERLTGYSATEVMGRNCRFLQGPDTDPNTVRQIRAALEAGVECNAVLKNYRKDGTPFWNDLNLSPVRDAEGAVTHYIGVQTDVTAIRASEVEKARLLTDLERAADQQWEFLKDVLLTATEGRLRLCDTIADLPAPLDEFLLPIPLDEANLRTLRLRAEDAAVGQGVSEERWQDFVVAVGETGMNAVMHARNGTGEVRAGGGRVQVWVRDSGEGIPLHNIHRATLVRGYTTSGTMGYGFFLSLRMCDTLYLLTGPGGTTAVLEINAVPPPPPWVALL